jgi:hypothetical protein
MGVGFGAVWLRAGSIWRADRAAVPVRLHPADHRAATCRADCCQTAQSIMLLAHGLYLLWIQSRENNAVGRIGSTGTWEVARG